MLIEFSLDRRNKKTGRNSWCKKCVNASGKVWQEKNKNKHNERQRRFYAKHAEDLKKKMREYLKKKRIENPEMFHAIYKRRKNTLNGRLNANIRSEIGASLKGSKNGRHWEILVGFTLKQLKKHLQKRFKPGMTWKNYGTNWHIDHKIPIAVFNFSTPEDIDFRLCWALKNLQPLDALENLKKHTKIEKSFQPSLRLSI
jgi:hypothetical protein